MINFFKWLESASKSVHEYCWQAYRFARTGDLYALYVITRIKRFHELSTLSYKLLSAREQARNHSAGAEWMRVHAAVADLYIGLYNDRKFWFMGGK